MADSPQPARTGWLQADPDQLDRFADELDELIVSLERIRAKAADAALFLSPSLDPATVRATRHLAQDAHDLPDTPTPAKAISMIIKDLAAQATAARLAARDYRAHEDEGARQFRRAGEPT
jgi:hypothetical protein